MANGRGDEPGIWGTFKTYLDLAKAVLALGAIAIYGFAKVANDAYLGALGLDAGDVGLTYSDVVSQAAVGFAFYLASGVVVAGLFLSFTIQRAAGKDGSQPRPGLDTPGERFLIVVLPVIGAFVPILLGLSVPSIIDTYFGLLEWGVGFWIVPFLVSTGIIGVLIGFVVVRWNHIETFFERTNVSPSLVGLALLVVASLTITTFIVAGDRGEFIGNKVLEGEVPSIHQFEMVAASAEPVCVNAPGDAEETQPGRVYLLLGSGDGRMILYDDVESAVLRTPIGGTTIVSAAAPAERKSDRIAEWRCPGTSP